MDKIVVMGVAGCGKSSVAAALARLTGFALIEGDDFHPPANVSKMRTGVPLDDADRSGWLEALCRELQQRPGGVVLTCSALRKTYRDRLRAAVPKLRFVHLELTRDEALRRVEQRGGGHYFRPSLVDSQFAALEDPRGESGVLSVDATETIDRLAARIIEWNQGDKP